ncbi:MAG: deoxyribodipyrimidine photo-lyase, partial [Pseudomonadota bacterium]
MPAPLIFWFRRDLRLSDNPGLTAAVETGLPIIPVFILDPETEALGAAPKWRLGEALRVFGEALAAVGSRLILRRGAADDVLKGLMAETGAEAVHWSRLYDPQARARDTAVKSAFKADGIEAVSHAGHVLWEPWTVETGSGGFYKVYTPFWKAVRGRDLPEPLGPPKLTAPEAWPVSDALDGWTLGGGMRRGGAVVAKYAQVGSAAAEARLETFVTERIAGYGEERDRLDVDATSRLSQNLTLGEISPRVCWFAGVRAMHEGKAGAEIFLKEIVWRDFAYHLLFHTPHIVDRNWRDDWDAFAWRGESDAAERWRQGRTGEPVIDAAMREMYVTGTMHNRARMLVASYLTKHLLTDWRIGLKWFEECL